MSDAKFGSRRTNDTIPLMLERWVWIAADLNTLSELSSSLVWCGLDFCFRGFAGFVESDAVRRMSGTISFLESKVLNVVRCWIVTFSRTMSDRDLAPSWLESGSGCRGAERGSVGAGSR